MSFDAKTLYELLPAIHRIRDAERGEPLQALIDVISEQMLVLEDDLAQLYDDQFAETAAPWVLPYIADLLGITGLPSSDLPALSSRGEVGHTIGYRRRKGTAAMLEQLAHDVTNWPARAVEFFQLIATTQYMNHIRLENESFIEVRGADRLEDLGTAFERGPIAAFPVIADLTHNIDVRRIAKGHGRYNIPNVGVFVWRLRAMTLTRSPAVASPSGQQRQFLFSPVALDVQLFTEPLTETSSTHLAEPINVPDPIRRRVLRRKLNDYYGSDNSIYIELYDPNTQGMTPVLSKDLVVCNLTGWTNLPSDKIAIDPVLGRIAFPQDEARQVLVTFRYGFSANMGGGEYQRTLLADTHKVGIHKVTGSIATALSSVGPKGAIVQIGDSGRYVETNLAIDATGKYIELRGAEQSRPTIELHGDLTITGGANDEVALDGLLLIGGAIQVSGSLRRLRLRHCTLVPGNTPTLIIKSANTQVEIDHCITGPIVTGDSVEMRIKDSIIDATSETVAAYRGNPQPFGAPLRITNSTVIGAVRTSILRLASNCIFLGSVVAERRQEGCARFSYLSPKARVPARYHCQPENDASLVRPLFTSTRFGDPGYCQLSISCPSEIREGADDESAMGAFHDLYEPQREARLRTRLEEYLRFGLESGVFYAS